MGRRGSGIGYFILGIYSMLISWYYNHSIFYLIIHWIFWPLYLLYELLKGHLAHGLWKEIPLSYFQ
jgi:hypothetical protein